MYQDYIVQIHQLFNESKNWKVAYKCDRMGTIEEKECFRGKKSIIDKMLERLINIKINILGLKPTRSAEFQKLVYKVRETDDLSITWSIFI
jgi:hypothetical protein